MITYTNPILRGFNPDPSICRRGEDFYMTVSSFEYLPGLPIYHSKDLIHWEMIGHALSGPEQMEFENAPTNSGIFAPTFRYHDGWFYIASTNVSRPGAMTPGGTGNFIIRAKDPAGEWSKPVYVLQNGIDPDLFFDDDGSVYFTSTADLSENGVNKSGTQMCRIDIETGEKKTESRIIHYGCGGCYPEAPHILKKDGWYYLMQAEGGTDTGHMETIARARDVWGPYTPCPHNPIITARDANVPPLSGIGHADMVQALDGSWWIVFLCSRLSMPYYHHLGRETALAPMEWEDGWPVVNGGRLPVDKMSVDREPLWTNEEMADDVAVPSRHVDFSNGLPREWVSIRKYFNSYEICENGIRLRGNQYCLSDRNTPAFFGRRQQDFECRLETCISFEPLSDNEEAGIALMHRHDGHYELVVTRRNGARVLLQRRCSGDMVTEKMIDISHLSGNYLCLKIVADRYNYEFFYKTGEQSGGNYESIAAAQTKMLSSEVVGGCMGTWAGIYASGNGVDCRNAALFTWFEYEILPEKPKRPMYGLE